jgi:hypothetical protein
MSRPAATHWDERWGRCGRRDGSFGSRDEPGSPGVSPGCGAAWQGPDRAESSPRDAAIPRRAGPPERPGPEGLRPRNAGRSDAARAAFPETDGNPQERS